MISFELSSEIPKCVWIQIFDSCSILMMGSALCMISVLFITITTLGGGGGGERTGERG